MARQAPRYRPRQNGEADGEADGETTVTRRMRRSIPGLLLALLSACGSDDVMPVAMSPIATSVAAIEADVVDVSVSGDAGSYVFSVTIASPDSGCGQYADWWEVLGADGSLLYRRVLLHSHVTEQPFVRTGGPVPVGAADSVWVRAHMNASGYGGQVLSGTAADGLAPMAGPRDFPAALEQSAPLPAGCDF